MITQPVNDDHDVIVASSICSAKWIDFFAISFLLVIEIEMCRIVQYVLSIYGSETSISDRRA